MRLTLVSMTECKMLTMKTPGTFINDNLHVTGRREWLVLFFVLSRWCRSDGRARLTGYRRWCYEIFKTIIHIHSVVFTLLISILENCIPTIVELVSDRFFNKQYIRNLFITESLHNHRLSLWLNSKLFKRCVPTLQENSHTMCYDLHVNMHIYDYGLTT